jgi:hypothetical protein
MTAAPGERRRLPKRGGYEAGPKPVKELRTPPKGQKGLGV